MLARRLGRALMALIVAAGILFGLFLIVPSVMGWERYVIVSGSMTGTYDRGSLVFDEVVPVKTLEVGDVITYRPPRGSGPEGLVTHRIRSIGRDPKTKVAVFRTKGDANTVADPWTFTLPNQQQARVVTGAPYMGFVLAALVRAQAAHGARRDPGPADRPDRPGRPVARHRPRSARALRDRRGRRRLGGERPLAGGAAGDGLQAGEARDDERLHHDPDPADRGGVRERR